ncbi:MAG: hypothetical protein ACJ8DS_22945 [Microvirga sp.]
MKATGEGEGEDLRDRAAPVLGDLGKKLSEHRRSLDGKLHEPSRDRSNKRRNRRAIATLAVNAALTFQSMIPKSGYRFSEKIMLKQRGRAG